jgi:purine-binding chemotaxis protein CheW
VRTERQLCTFLMGGLTFGVPVDRVQEVMRFQPMTRVPLANHSIAGLINLRGQIVTAVDLRRRVGMPDRPDDQPPANVVIRADDGGVSLLVDEIGGVIEVNDEDFEEPPNTTPANVRPLLVGVCKLPDRLLLLLDVDRVLATDLATTA